MYIPLSGCLDVSLASTVYNELYNAQKNLILTTDLHLLTLVVPIDLINSITPNWVVFFNKVRRKSIYLMSGCCIIRYQTYHQMNIESLNYIILK